MSDRIVAQFMKAMEDGWTFRIFSEKYSRIIKFYSKLELK